MERQKFKYYEKRPCKFIFRSGKEVFGVVWEDESNPKPNYFFASNGDFQKFQSQKASMSLNGYNFELEDLIYAEIL